VIAIGPADPPAHHQAIRSLIKGFPEKFTLIELKENISAEGGDQELVWTPGGNIALMVGRHRVFRFMERTMQSKLEERGMSDDMIERSRQAYSRSYLGIPAIIMPEKVLRDPALGSEEIFHLDMLAAFMGRRNGKVEVFVPTFQKERGDSQTAEMLDPEMITAVQNEYEEAAHQLGGLGYTVFRVPLADHPVRNPVNIGKFRDPRTNQYSVLLSKYPYHLPRSSDQTPQKILQKALDKIVERGERFQRDPSEKNCDRFCAALNEIWEVIDRVSAMGNPVFNKQAEFYKKNGYQVIEVPDFSWGTGGIHCKFLH
jgi:hypothetical protein